MDVLLLELCLPPLEIGEFPFERFFLVQNLLMADFGRPGDRPYFQIDLVLQFIDLGSQANHFRKARFQRRQLLLISGAQFGDLLLGNLDRLAFENLRQRRRITFVYLCYQPLCGQPVLDRFRHCLVDFGNVLRDQRRIIARQRYAFPLGIGHQCLFRFLQPLLGLANLLLDELARQIRGLAALVHTLIDKTAHNLVGDALGICRQGVRIADFEDARVALEIDRKVLTERRDSKTLAFLGC